MTDICPSLWWKLVQKVKELTELTVFFFFFLLNQTLVFLCDCFKIEFGFSQHVTHLSENRSLFFEIKRFCEIAEIGVYVRQLPETPKTR